MNNNIKTLIGKEGYLFLINDSGCSLKKHTLTEYKHISNQKTRINNRYLQYFNKILIVVFPDKEIICSKYLPNNITIIDRPYLNLYKEIFKENIIDNIDILEESDYYKTDTHINNKGALKVYTKICQRLNDIFNVKITLDKYSINTNKVSSLAQLHKGLGDLTSTVNKGKLELSDISDIYYDINNCKEFYANVSFNDNEYCILDYKLNNISDKYKDQIINWDCLSNNILYKKNEQYFINKTVVIFYDSFLISTLNLYKDIFKEIYLIKKIFLDNIINLIKPDFIIEFRVERFLFA